MANNEGCGLVHLNAVLRIRKMAPLENSLRPGIHWRDGRR